MHHQFEILKITEFLADDKNTSYTAKNEKNPVLRLFIR